MPLWFVIDCCNRNQIDNIDGNVPKASKARAPAHMAISNAPSKRFFLDCLGSMVFQVAFRRGLPAHQTSGYSLIQSKLTQKKGKFSN